MESIGLGLITNLRMKRFTVTIEDIQIKALYMVDVHGWIFLVGCSNEFIHGGK